MTGMPLPASVQRVVPILIASGILFLATVIFYAGGAAFFVLRELAVDGAAIALWLIAAMGFGTLLVQIFRVRFSSVTLHIVTAAASGLGLMSIAVLLLGLAGALNRISAIAMLGVGAIVCVGQLMRAGKHRQTIKPVTSVAWLWLIVAIVAGIVTVAAMVPPGILFGDEPNGYDVLEYHLQVPREWFEAGRITPLKHNVYSFLPFGVEMHYLLAMYVRGGAHAAMYLAQLMHATMIALSVAAVWGVLAELNFAGATVGAVLVATTPWMMLLAPIAYNEGGLLLFGSLAIGLSMIALRDAQQRVRLMILAGAMAGFACGAKLTAAPMILIAVPVSILIARQIPFGSLDNSRLLRASIAFVIAGLVTFSPWAIRNFAWTGNPVFPEATSLLGRAHFSEAQATRWHRAHAPRADQHGVLARARAATNQIYLDWRFGIFVIPLGLISFGLNIRQREAWFLFILLVEITFIWLAFTHLQGRFLVLAIPICGMLVGLCRQRWMIPLVAIAGVIGIGLVHARLMEFDRRVPLANVLVTPKLDGLAAFDDSSLPPDAHVALIGDARAFLYSGIPMSRLHYRTVFDVDPKRGESALDAWRRGTESLAPPVADVIDPAELARFARTYFGIPPPPADVAARTEPYVQWR